MYDLDHLYRALTSAISGPAEVYIAKDKQGNEIGEPLGLPIYLILDPLSNTSAAYDLFRKKEFNSAMKKLLDGWGEYFKDENSGSNCVLNTSETGWFGKHGLDELQLGLRGLSFEQTYGVKPEEAQAKYKSWDAFFTREFKDIKTVRPIKVPEHHTPLYNACDAFCFRLAHSVKLDDTFWLKGQNYTLYDMFGGDPQTTQESLSSWAPKFAGGSVYQGALFLMTTIAGAAPSRVQSSRQQYCLGPTLLLCPMKAPQSTTLIFGRVILVVPCCAPSLESVLQPPVGLSSWSHGTSPRPLPWLRSSRSE